MPKLRVFDDVRVNYEYRKDKEPCILFIHPWSTNLTVWDNEKRYLSKKGFSTLRYDIRGHGLSDEPLTRKAYSLLSLTKEIESLVNRLKLKKIIIVAHSFGGMIASNYYVRNKSKVEKIIFIDSVFSDPFKPGLLKKITFFTEYIASRIEENKKIKIRHFKKIKEFNFSRHHKNHALCDMEQFISTPFFSALETAELIFMTDLKKKIRQIKIPVLVLAGDSDFLVSIKNQRKLFKGMDNVSFRIIKHGKHNLITEHPGIISENIFKFLS